MNRARYAAVGIVALLALSWEVAACSPVGCEDNLNCSPYGGFGGEGGRAFGGASGSGTGASAAGTSGVSGTSGTSGAGSSGASGESGAAGDVVPTKKSEAVERSGRVSITPWLTGARGGALQITF